MSLRRTASGAAYPARESIGPNAGLPAGLKPPPIKPGPSGQQFYLTQDQLEALLTAVWKRGNLIVQTFVASNAGPIVLRPQEKRYYFFIQNQSAVNQLSVNFGRAAGPLGIVPVDGIVVAPNFGFYEPLMVPQDAISVMAAGAGTAGVLIYSTVPG